MYDNLHIFRNTRLGGLANVNPSQNPPDSVDQNFSPTKAAAATAKDAPPSTWPLCSPSPSFRRHERTAALPHAEEYFLPRVSVQIPALPFLITPNRHFAPIVLFLHSNCGLRVTAPLGPRNQPGEQETKWRCVAQHSWICRTILDKMTTPYSQTLLPLCFLVIFRRHVCGVGGIPNAETLSIPTMLT